MYPPVFEYQAPDTLEGALAALAELGDEGRVLAGGQSLIPMMKLRLAAPSHLVDINRIGELSYVRRENGSLCIGALARHNDVVGSAEAKASGVVSSAAPWISDPLVRNRGTVCGSVAHCDPEGDWNSVMLAARADVIAQSSAGSRSIGIDDFIVSFFTNALEPGEMVTGVCIPIPSGPSGGAYMKLERKIGDYATVGVATQLELASNGTIAQAGIGLTAVNYQNTRASAAEDQHPRAQPSDELFAEAGAAAAAASDPQTDVRGDAEWKRNVVAVYTRRGLAKALASATS
ncbi:MAG: xanthine dehydrogenase family protein subunit M [Acidimicrobiia bacterium]|nr:xanthine dehydrogenase family protein subunit M [Acidimicrobiia bacterium]